ncbi:MAG: amidohydrolase family protein [Actinobacteria bacterium]|nr:amidohydrolase family protein [Actinomycetota bacterium]
MGASTDLPLIDHHCHGVVAALDPGGFERWITESDRPPAPGTRWFDTPLGLAIRAWCAPFLDLEPGTSPEDYVARRGELGQEEVGRRLFAACGLEQMLVDTGIAGLGLAGPDELAALTGIPAREVVRIEAVAEALARRVTGADAFLAAFAAALDEAAAGAVGLKTIAAYRHGLALADAPPPADEVRRALERRLPEIAAGARLADPVLLDLGVWTGVEVARERGLPLQVHTGFGDTDVDLRLADPTLLTPLIRALDPLGVDLTLLHCYPYHRQAAYLAAMYPHVYFDLGLTLNHAIAGAPRIMAEAMEMAPFGKQLYSSDAIAIPELHYLGARAFRGALDAVLDGWSRDGLLGAADAERIAVAIARGNAARIYPLG